MDNVVLIGSRRKIRLSDEHMDGEGDIAEILKSIPEGAKTGFFLISALQDPGERNKELFGKLKTDFGLKEGKRQYKLKKGYTEHHGYLAKGYMTGNAPLLALHDACEEIRKGELDFAIIGGYEPLMSKYDREKALKHMADIYGPKLVELGLTIPLGYTLLAEVFRTRNEISEEFPNLVDMVNENLKRTAEQVHSPTLIREADKQITSLFKARDCAFPWIDFAGGVILASEEKAEELGIKERIYVSGVSCSQIRGPEARSTGYLPPAYANVVAEFTHLEKAIRDACSQAQIKRADTLGKHAVMEAYTCFPVIPLALLSKLAPKHHVEETLNNVPLTVTGGMHYAGAPWCNPALNGLVAVHEKLLKEEDKKIGLVHGNGGTGENQGICILRKDEPGKLKPSLFSSELSELTKYKYNPNLNGNTNGKLLCTAKNMLGNHYSIELRQSGRDLFFSRRP